MLESWKTYLGNNSDKRFSEFVSPMLAKNVSHVPPTLIFAAAFDPLQDEACFYARYLKKEGVIVKFHCFEAVTHHFWLMNFILDTSVKAHKMAVEFLVGLNKTEDQRTADQRLELDSDR